MEGRKEAFRMYLERTGTTDALTKVFIKLYELKDKKPDNVTDALKFMKDNLSNDYPTQEDYDKLLKEVEASRIKVAEIRKEEEAALLQAEIDREKKRRANRTAGTASKVDQGASTSKSTTDADGAGTTPTPASKAVVADIAIAVVTTIAEAKARLEALKQNQDCKSLLVKNLEVALIPADDKAEKLLLCIRRGLEDPNIPVGIYAAQEDCYITFKDIFEKIVKDHFGIAALTEIKSSSWKAPTGKDDSSLNFRSNLVLGTRIKCARSIDRFKFVPELTADQLKKLMTDVEAELKLLADDTVKGQYLNSNDSNVKDELKKMQLMFNETGNKQLQAAEVKDFTSGRAIFCTNDRKLVVWVNEEEHLKFIATGEDSIKQTFVRLRTVVENCEYLTFKPKPTSGTDLGCLTFCPTFLSPALHVSVVVKFPNVAARGTVEKLADESKICVKPTTITDEYEITNKPKLDVNEFEALVAFIAGLKTFLEQISIKSKEHALARLQELQNVTPKPPKPESLLIEHLTEELFNELMTEDETVQKSFLNCIRLGLEDGKLPMGIYAVDHDAYKKFEKIFKPILKGFYDLKDTDTLKSEWSSTDPDDKLNLTSHLILRSRITCAKSVEKYSFVPTMSGTDLNKLKDEISSALTADPLNKSFPGTFKGFPLDDAALKAKLEKLQLLFEPENDRLKAAGATEFSNGRAIFHSNNDKITVWVNEEEHLKFIATETYDANSSTNIIKDAFITLRTVVQHCEGKTPFKKSAAASGAGLDMDKLGCLTFCPMYLGSTIHASAVVKIPKVAARSTIEDTIKALSISVKPTKVKDQFEITNKPKLNKTEFAAIQEFVTEVNTFLKEAQIKTKDDAVARLAELQTLVPVPQSLLVKHLTADIINQKGDVQTTSQKTLLDCIRMGLEDENSPVGIYAADADSYVKFETVFKPILEDLYGGLANIVVDSKWEADPGAALTVLKSELILRTRISCARSIENNDFVPAMTNDQLTALVAAVQTQLESPAFKTPCAGTFVVLESLQSDAKGELEKQQLLFETDNIRLKAAGVTDFSKGRAIFYSTAKNLAIWVNEEEHLKFISTGTKSAADEEIIKNAFERLSTAVSKCDLTFRKCANTAAYLKECQATLCPTYLGTAIHISVVVKLEKAAARGNVNEIAEPLKICVKPTAVSDEFEVTNIPKLDKTEFDATNEFIVELTKLLDREVNLITTIDKAWAAWELAAADTTMNLSKPTNQQKFNEASALGSTANKKTLLDCIRPGLEDAQMGFYAVDADAYEKFGEIFKSYVDVIHKPDTTAAADNDWAGTTSTLTTLGTYAKSSRITCRRSFNEFPFIPAMNTTQLRQMRAKVKAILETVDSTGKFYDLDGIDDQTKQNLIAGNHWFEPVNKRLRCVGVKDFTTGRAVFVSTDKKLTVWLCEEDHLKFISTDEDGNIAKTFDRLKDAVGKFEKGKFERHATWGWKTFCPENLGSTIEATIVLELTKATEAIEDTIKTTITDIATYCDTCSPAIVVDGLKFCEIAADGSTPKLYEISNAKKFGTEFALVSQVYEVAKKLVAEEA